MKKSDFSDSANTREAAPEADVSRHKNPRPPHSGGYRSVWISDIHLGSQACKAHALLNFLHQTSCETLYLVGDIIDGWRLRRGGVWCAEHTAIIRLILNLANRGVHVIYVPGNHDELLRAFPDLELSHIHLQRQAVHHTADGRRLWVLHGDKFDLVCSKVPWLMTVGDNVYRTFIKGNGLLNGLGRALGYPPDTIDGLIRRKVVEVVALLSDFEHAAAHHARRRGYDGVVCGHVHAPAQRLIDGVLYCNTGDWVNNCTALVEHHTGQLELLCYPNGEHPVIATESVHKE